MITMLGLIPFLLQHSALYKRIANTPVVFTIHNGQYHGAFGWDKVGLAARDRYDGSRTA
jgi:starch synthase